MVNGMADWRSRVRGSLVLAACGDALGAAFEGRSGIAPERIAAAVERPESPLRWTDDTAQMLVLAEHLVEHGGRIEPDALAAGFAEAWSAEPWRGYGPGAARLLSQIATGTPWKRASRSLFDGEGSLGNGAAMRVAPVGLLQDRNLDSVTCTAVASALVTHSHPEGIDGAVAQAVAVAVAATDEPLEDLVETIASHTATDAFTAELRAIPALLDGPAADISDRFRCDATALGSVPAAIAVFLRHPEDPAAAVEEAIGFGGDTDTVAAMAAAMVGARCGEDAVPEAWTAQLERTRPIAGVADGLAGLEPRR